MRKRFKEIEEYTAPFAPIETYKRCFSKVRREQGSADFEMWAAYPDLWEKLSIIAGDPESTWLHQVQEVQARELRRSFQDWRREFCTVPPELDLLEKTLDAAKPGRLVDRIEDDQLHLAVTALTENFLHSVGPEAKALGVPPEALLWATMLYDGVMSRDYTLPDMLRVVTRAEEIWSKARRMPFDDPEELEAFIFAVLIDHAHSSYESWKAEIPDGVVYEYVILRDFCGFMEFVGGHTEFGKAMACGLPFQPSLTNVEEFRERAAAAAKRFDEMWFDACVPF
ncbi:hypothetical protein [Rhizobium johnstonii]|uniref:hypothetical protein n=1 Tax=Rhizobium johnstonii TaxID=3019933 RepID=UPI003F9AB43B